ncbi:MAG: viroplasmin family protein [Microcystaceae cyanobacterium]
MATKKYYVVWQGRRTGIFASWQDCKQQVDGFKGAKYKSFKTRGEAEEAFGLTQPLSLLSVEPETEQTLTLPHEIVKESICVDASCMGNPGIVEYRGVDTVSGEVLFHKSPMSNGTNNLGEFLAIVHGLAYLQQQDKMIPIYSDSMTAISWVKKKKVKTTLQQDSSNEEIFNLLNRSLKWLDNNRYTNPILKWQTVSWGEIPADFGRK